MGWFDIIGNLVDVVAEPAIRAFSGDPIGAATSVTKDRPQPQPRVENTRGNNMFTQDPGQSQGFSGFSNVTRSTSSPSFFSNLGQTIGGFGSDVGQFFRDIQPATNLLGLNNPIQRTNAGVAQTIIRQRPDETASSGEILGANLGMAPALFQAGRNFLRTPGGSTALGFGAGALGAVFSGDGSSAPRITRKMKSDVRRIYMMAGMNPDVTAQILNNMGTYPRMQFDASLVFFILTKRFRNDGPVVTKAAVRKTRTTIRRMKGIVDLHNSICKTTAPRKRAAPSRAKAVQLISNK